MRKQATCGSSESLHGAWRINPFPVKLLLQLRRYDTPCFTSASVFANKFETYVACSRQWQIGVCSCACRSQSQELANVYKCFATDFLTAEPSWLEHVGDFQGKVPRCTVIQDQLPGSIRIPVKRPGFSEVQVRGWECQDVRW